MCRDGRGRSREAGLALIILLVVVMSAALLGAAMGGVMLNEMQLGQNDNNLIRAQYFAEAALAAGWYQMLYVDGAGWTTNNGRDGGPYQPYVQWGENNGQYFAQLDPQGNSALKIMVGEGHSTFPVFTSISSYFPAVVQLRQTALFMPTAFTYALYSATTMSIVGAASSATTVTNLTTSRTVVSSSATSTLASLGIGTVFVDSQGTSHIATCPAAAQATTLCVTPSTGSVSIAGPWPSVGNSGPTPGIDPSVACNTMSPCGPHAPATPVLAALVPLPTLQLDSGAKNYKSKAQAAGTYYQNAGPAATPGTFYNAACTTWLNRATGITRIPAGIYFVEDGQVVFNNTNCLADVVLNGTLIVYNGGGNATPWAGNGSTPYAACTAATPCGDVVLCPNPNPAAGPCVDATPAAAYGLQITSRNGEPALVVGGGIYGEAPPPPETPGAGCGSPNLGGVVSLKGIVYALANTTNVAANVPGAGWCVGADNSGSNSVTVVGTLAANLITAFQGSATWTPSIFFLGLPTGMTTQQSGGLGGPIVNSASVINWTLLPLSRSSGQ